MEVIHLRFMLYHSIKCLRYKDVSVYICSQVQKEVWSLNYSYCKIGAFKLFLLDIRSKS